MQSTRNSNEQTQKEKREEGIFQNALVLFQQKKERVQIRFIISYNKKQENAEGIKIFLLTISKNRFFNPVKCTIIYNFHLIGTNYLTFLV